MEPMYPKQDQMKVSRDNFPTRWMVSYEKFRLEKKIIPQGNLNRYARKGSRGHKIMHGGQLYFFFKKKRIQLHIIRGVCQIRRFCSS